MKNCLTRAVVMAEGSIVQADDILLEGDPFTPAASKSEHSRDESGAADLSEPVSVYRPPAGVKLNVRQEKALPQILQRGGVTRSEYQDLVGGALPSRTALYDLKDLVEKRIMVRVGQGPATRYVPAAGG